jgi:hypothetical protein
MASGRVPFSSPAAPPPPPKRRATPASERPSIQGLNLKEFFLLLSSTGLAYRRCELVRVNGTEIDVQFLKAKNKKKKPGAKSKQDALVGG